MPIASEVTEPVKLAVLRPPNVTGTTELTTSLSALQIAMLHASRMHVPERAVKVTFQLEGWQYANRPGNICAMVLPATVTAWGLDTCHPPHPAGHTFEPDGAPRTDCRLILPEPRSVMITLLSVDSRFRVLCELFNAPLFSSTNRKPAGTGGALSCAAVLRLVLTLKR